MEKIAVIVVTHNSQQDIQMCLAALRKQENVSLLVIVVDSGSADPSYLDSLQDNPDTLVFRNENIGFSRANNLGYSSIPPGIEYVLFLNPDAFPAKDALTRALAIMERESQVACLTGRLLGYDRNKGGPNGLLDSTGIFRKWYGRWYDRGQGEVEKGQYRNREYLSAACGAFMFCRKSCLDRVALRKNEIFDPDFFLYKEDIELSLRLREKGFQILYASEIEIFHCRGWQKEREKVPFKLRRLSASNEILLCLKHPSLYIFWAFFKYLLVILFRV
jgi:N-acetylglucosaminyl-diphospho-decaprenol L-rhamnosyltransferase